MIEDITTISLSRSTKVKLNSIGGKLSLERGRDLSQDEIILELIDFYEKA